MHATEKPLKHRAHRIDSSTKTEWNIVKTKHTRRVGSDDRPQHNSHIRHQRKHAHNINVTNGPTNDDDECVCVCEMYVFAANSFAFTVCSRLIVSQRLLFTRFVDYSRRHSEEAKTNE